MTQNIACHVLPCLNAGCVGGGGGLGESKRKKTDFKIFLFLFLLVPDNCNEGERKNNLTLPMVI